MLVRLKERGRGRYLSTGRVADKCALTTLHILCLPAPKPGNLCRSSLYFGASRNDQQRRPVSEVEGVGGPSGAPDTKSNRVIGSGLRPILMSGIPDQVEETFTDVIGSIVTFLGVHFTALPSSATSVVACTLSSSPTDSNSTSTVDFSALGQCLQIPSLCLSVKIKLISELGLTRLLECWLPYSRSLLQLQVEDCCQRKLKLF